MQSFFTYLVTLYELTELFKICIEIFLQIVTKVVGFCLKFGTFIKVERLQN